MGLLQDLAQAQVAFVLRGDPIKQNSGGGVCAWVVGGRLVGGRWWVVGLVQDRLQGLLQDLAQALVAFVLWGDPIKITEEVFVHGW